MPCCSAEVCSGATLVSASAPKPVVTPYIVRPPATARSTTSRAARTRSRAEPANVTCAPRATATTSSSVSGSPIDTGTAARLRAARPPGKRRIALHGRRLRGHLVRHRGGRVKTGEQPRRGWRQDGQDDQRDAERDRERPPVPPDLLDEDRGGERRHHGDVHGPDRDQDDHETPTAADAVEAVMHADPEIASGTLEACVVEQRTDRGSAMPQARVLQRRQLID